MHFYFTIVNLLCNERKVLTDFDQNRETLLLHYEEVAEKTNEATADLVRDVMQKVGLLSYLEVGKIPMCTEYALFTCALSLSTIEFANPCNFHNLGRLICNIITNLDNFSDDLRSVIFFTQNMKTSFIL